MDGNAKLTETTLSKSLSVLHMALSHALEKGKTKKATETEGFLMDQAFSVAWLAGWIELPESRLSPELQYILTPEARKQYAESDPPPTVILGGIEVPETFHDEFVSLFWQNQPERNAQIAARINESVEAALSDPNFDPIEDLKASIARARQIEPDIVTKPPEAQPTKTTKLAVWLIDAKKELGVSSWEQFCLMASKHLEELQAQQQKERIIAPRTSWRVTKHDIFRLLRGENIRVIKVKAIAVFLNAELANSPLRPPGGWHFKHFIWPKEARRRGRPPKQ